MTGVVDPTFTGSSGIQENQENQEIQENQENQENPEFQENPENQENQENHEIQNWFSITRKVVDWHTAPYHA